MKWLVVLLATFATSLASAQSDLSQCDFNKSNGGCSQDIDFNAEGLKYRIAATGACRTVTVLIDGTQAPHKIKDTDVVQSITVFENSKTPTVSVTGCTSHPTKREVFDQCMAANPPCGRMTFDEAVGCLNARSDSVNKCVGSTACTVALTDNDVTESCTPRYP